VAVDPVHDRIVAASASSVRGGTTGLFYSSAALMYGDIPPRGVIAGPRTGIVRPWQLAVDSRRKRFRCSHQQRKSSAVCARNAQERLAPGHGSAFAVGILERRDLSACGVSTTTATFPPRALIKGAGSYLVHPAGVAIDPKAGEIFVTDGVRNGFFTFLAPKFFLQAKNSTEKAAQSFRTE